ncbi:MAG: hypothetical protein PHX25_00055 [Candidatus Pacebacteria bacterium]|nr:hypothetical protein [Candidatus Paceibacterota bacterium]
MDKKSFITWMRAIGEIRDKNVQRLVIYHITDLATVSENWETWSSSDKKDYLEERIESLKKLPADNHDSGRIDTIISRLRRLEKDLMC